MNPQYTDLHLADYYSRYTEDEPQWDEPLRYGHDFYLKILESFIPARGSLLDIGSGKGHLLGVALQRGWKATGYEIDCDLARKLSTTFGVQVYCGTFN
jgi:SAM-dependent methyltransferase